LLRSWPGRLRLGGGRPAAGPSARPRPPPLAQRGSAAFAKLRDELLLALRHGSGWTSSLWPHPQTRRSTSKLSYLKRLVTPDGRILVVGAGVYQHP
jgi:hypothetical protein